MNKMEELLLLEELNKLQTEQIIRKRKDDKK